MAAEPQPRPSVDFFFDCSCPWTYFAFVRLRESAVRTGALICYRPVLLDLVVPPANPGSPGPGYDPKSPKARYYVKDIRDWARFCGVRFSLPTSRIGRVEWAQRGAIAAQQLGMIVPYLAAVFAARFEAGLDISSLPVTLDAAVAAGLDRQSFERRIHDPETLEILRQNSADLVARGGFGSPTMLVGEDLYFGNDRMPLVEIALVRAAGNRFIMPGEHGA